MRLAMPTVEARGPVEAVIAARRTVRDFDDRPVSLTDVSRLLWVAQGVTAERGGASLRAAPSAGALHPLSVTLVAGNVTGLPPGGYLYDPDAHTLTDVTSGDLRPVLGDVAIGPQPWLRQGALVLLVTGDRGSAEDAYADQPPDGPGISRGVRYLHNEVGCAAQNVLLQATGTGLGAVFVGGFDDDALVARLPALLPAGHVPLALIAVGWPA